MALLPILACTESSSPFAPAFSDLGFDDALPVVREQAQGAYQRWQKDPDNHELNGSLGMILSAYGKSAASEQFFQRAQSLAPLDFRWAYYLAISKLQLGQYQQAADFFRQALTIDPNSLEARKQLANALLETNQIEESLALYQAITNEHPDQVDGWLGLGKALDYSGDLSGAIAALERARDIGPEYGEVHFALAGALNANGNRAEAAQELKAYEKTVHNKINRSDRFTRSVIRLNVSDTPYLAKADYQISRGQFAAAVSLFERALAVNPDNQDAWGGLIFAHAKLGDADVTRQSYQAALDADIKYKRVHFTYAQALREWEQHDDARSIMSKAIELDPQYSEALLAMAELEQMRGAHAAAVTHYRAAVTVTPNDQQVRLALAQALNQSQQFNEAVVELESLNSNSAAPAKQQALILKELALAYLGNQQQQSAIDTLKKARDIATERYDSATLRAINMLMDEWQETLSPAPNFD